LASFPGVTGLAGTKMSALLNYWSWGWRRWYRGSDN